MSEQDRNERVTAVEGELLAARNRAVETAYGVGDQLQQSAHEVGERARYYGAVGADYARRAGSNAASFASANALPLSLIGLGVGWLVFSARRGSAGGRDANYYDEFGGFDAYAEQARGQRGALTAVQQRAGAIASSVQERAGALASGVQERAGAIAGSVQERAGALAGSVQERAGAIASGVQERAGAIASRARDASTQIARRVGDGYDDARHRAGELASHAGEQAAQWSHDARDGLTHAGRRTVEYADENPLLIGAVAIAAGVGVGLALPATQREDQLLGETRDRLFDDARGLLGEARSALDDARQTARETAREVQRQARETKEELREAVKEPRISH